MSQGICTEWFSVGGQTIVAGCGMATTLLKVYTLKLFDALQKWHPQVDLRVCVDDVDLFCARRCASEAADKLAGAARLLLQVFDQALRLQVGYQKCVLLATSATAEGCLRQRLKGSGLKLHSWGKKLGVQFVLRKRRRAALVRQRAGRAERRARRIRFLRGAASAASRARLAAATVYPVATYGGCYWGYADHAVARLRRMAVTAVLPPARFRSSSILFLLQAWGMRDPAVIAHQQPIATWASMIWNRRHTIAKLEWVLAWAKERLAPSQPWRRCNGPTQAYVLTCQRLGWDPIAASVIRLDDGRELNLGEVPPRIVSDEVRKAVERWTWRRVGQSMSGTDCGAAATAADPRGRASRRAPAATAAGTAATAAGSGTAATAAGSSPAATAAGSVNRFTRGGFIEGAKSLLWTYRRSPELCGSLINIISGAIPTQSQVRQLKFARGAVDTATVDHCPVCLQSVEAGYGHWWWECALSQAWRHQYCLPDLVAAVPATAGTLWAQRGLAASPLTTLALPLKEAQVICSVRPRDGILSGVIYTDGSGIHTHRAETARAGWGVSTVDPMSGRVTGAAHGPLPLFSQTVGNAEIFAATIALRMAAPPVQIVTDYQHFHDGWEQGFGSYTGDGSKCGAAWTLFWAAAGDFGLTHISVRKVPAHMPFPAVTEGRISYCDWVGNRRADLEAKRGAALHPCNQEHVQSANRLKQHQRQLCLYLAQLNLHSLRKGWPKFWHGEFQPEGHTPGAMVVDAAATAADTAGEQGASIPAMTSSELISEAASGDAATAAPLEFLQGAAATAAGPQVLLRASATAEGPGFHCTHVIYRTVSFWFCARCGAYCAQTTRRSTAFIAVCRGAPLTKHGLLVRDRLMRGIEPVRPLRHTGVAATPLLSPAGS